MEETATMKPCVEDCGAAGVGQHSYLMPIRRHVKVQAEATTYDPAYDDYFRQRREKQRRMRARVFAPVRTEP